MRPIGLLLYRIRRCVALLPFRSYEEQIVYLDPAVTALQKGDRVRITGGVFEGVEGIILRVKGDRRVSVCIKGVMAVATAYVHPSLMELVSDPVHK